jgi:hypothetical protein
MKLHSYIVKTINISFLVFLIFFISISLTLHSLKNLGWFGALFTFYKVITWLLGIILILKFFNPRRFFSFKEGKKQRWLGKLLTADRIYYLFFLILLVCIYFLVTQTAGLIDSDGLFYYFYVRSLYMDGDLEFTNEYRAFSLDWRSDLKVVPETGHRRNIYSFGTAFFWLPFYPLGMLTASLLKWSGADVILNGFSYPYAVSIHLASMLYAFIALMLIYKILKDFFSPRISAIAVIGIWLASPLAWYMVYQPHMAHCLSLFTVTLFIYLWYRSRAQRSWKLWLLMGIVAGWMIMVRIQNGLFMLLPAVEAFLAYISHIKRKEISLIKKLLLNNLIFLGAVLVGFFPQMIVWKIIFGRFYIGNPYGDAFLRWTSPWIMEVLFSARHGLLSWTPVLYFSLIGLFIFLRKEKKLMLLFLIVFLAMLWVNSSAASWWAGGSFGDRRFINCSIIFAFGLAAFAQWLSGWIKRKPLAMVEILLALLIIWNGLMMIQFKAGMIPTEEPVSFTKTAQNQIALLFSRIGYPFSYPANLIFSMRWGLSPDKYDRLTGRYLFYGAENLGGYIDIGGDDEDFLGPGWSYQEREKDGRTFRWSLGHKSSLFVCLMERQNIIISFTAQPYTFPHASRQHIKLSINERYITSFVMKEGFQLYSVEVGKEYWRRAINRIDLEYGYTIRPHDAVGSSDNRPIAVAFDFFRFSRK